MGIGFSELHYPKKSFNELQVKEKVSKMPMHEHWKIEENHKDYIAKFNPPKVKLLKQFRSQVF